MQRLTFKFFAHAALAPLSLISALAISPSYADNNTETNSPIAAVEGLEVESLVIETQSIPQMIYLDARLEAANKSTISAQTSGVVESINADVNDQVNKGQTLITINNTQQKAGLSQAKANLANAQALNEDAQILLNRNRSLIKKRSISQGDLDRSIAQAKSTAASVAAARASVKQAQEQLSYTHIIAPYSGIVSQRMVELGELVNPGQALMTGFSAQPLRAITHIPQHLASQLSTDNLDISIRFNGKHYPVTGYTIFPYADSSYSTVQARIDLEPNSASNKLMPGTWVEVGIPTKNKKSITVPTSAVIQQGEVASLYIVDTNTQQLTLRYVRLGNTMPTILNGLNNKAAQVEVLSGLKSGETIAINALIAASKGSEQ